MPRYRDLARARRHVSVAGWLSDSRPPRWGCQLVWGGCSPPPNSDAWLTALPGEKPEAELFGKKGKRGQFPNFRQPFLCRSGQVLDNSPTPNQAQARHSCETGSPDSDLGAPPAGSKDIDLVTVLPSFRAPLKKRDFRKFPHIPTSRRSRNLKMRPDQGCPTTSLALPSPLPSPSKSAWRARSGSRKRPFKK